MDALDTYYSKVRDIQVTGPTRDLLQWIAELQPSGLAVVYLHLQLDVDSDFLVFTTFDDNTITALKT